MLSLQGNQLNISLNELSTLASFDILLKFLLARTMLLSLSLFKEMFESEECAGVPHCCSQIMHRMSLKRWVINIWACMFLCHIIMWIAPVYQCKHINSPTSMASILYIVNRHCVSLHCVHTSADILRHYFYGEVALVSMWNSLRLTWFPVFSPRRQTVGR